MTVSETRALRGQIRTWRRSRADIRLVEVFSDAYIALFATVMLGTILVNVVLGVGRLSDAGCSSAACTGARSVLPLLVALAALSAVLAVARFVGPVFVSPALSSLLMSSPVDRRALLRPRLVWGQLVGAVLAAFLTAVAAGLSGWSIAAGTLLTGTVGVLVAGVVATAARAQSLPRAGPVARALSLASCTPVIALWSALLAVALNLTDGTSPPDPRGAVALACAAAAALGVAGVVAGFRGLRLLSRRDVSRGAGLAPGLSGAWSALDLALAYDVVLDHRWRGHLPVRSRRAGRGPRLGPAALLRADLARVTRSPSVLLVVAAAAVVPYAVGAAGTGRAVLFVAPLMGFLAGLPMLAGLRVLERTSSLARLLPFSTPRARAASVAVPASCLLLYGLGCAPAVALAIGTAPGISALLGVAVGVSSLAASVRWVTGRPPDYSRPLVSTPAGAVPTNLYGSALRGLDILVMTAGPLALLSDTMAAAEVSLALSALVLAVLLGRSGPSA